MTSKLTLGPILFNWAPQKKRDFYFKIADESPIDMVYIGEVVCSKRQPVFAPYIDECTKRLQSAGKKVVYSSLSLVMSEKEVDEMRLLSQETDVLVEVNDMSCVSLLANRPHCIGPYINVYNEVTLDYLAKLGAVSVTLPPELPSESIAVLAKQNEVDIEIQIFGRLPLAISSRCSHARIYDLTRSNCKLICERDSNGVEASTSDGDGFLTINGLQTLSYTYYNLANELDAMVEMGVKQFRLSPHDVDMVEISKLFRDLLNNNIEKDAVNERLKSLLPNAKFSNGFYHGKSGCQLVKNVGCG